MFNLDTLEFVKKLDPPHYDGVNALCSMSDTLLLSASRDKVIKQWKIGSDDSVTQEKVISGSHQDWVTALCKHNKSIYSACRDGTVGRWNADTMMQIASVGVHASSVNSLASSQSLLFTASNDRTIKIWKELPTI
jgi:WD40 repeat protein